MNNYTKRSLYNVRCAHSQCFMKMAGLSDIPYYVNTGETPAMTSYANSITND